MPVKRTEVKSNSDPVRAIEVEEAIDEAQEKNNFKKNSNINIPLYNIIARGNVSVKPLKLLLINKYGKTYFMADLEKYLKHNF